MVYSHAYSWRMSACERLQTSQAAKTWKAREIVMAMHIVIVISYDQFPYPSKTCKIRLLILQTLSHVGDYLVCKANLWTNSTSNARERNVCSLSPHSETPARWTIIVVWEQNERAERERGMKNRNGKWRVRLTILCVLSPFGDAREYEQFRDAVQFILEKHAAETGLSLLGGGQYINEGT